MTGGHDPVDREQNGTEVTIKLRSQDLNLFPLQGYLVEVDVRREVIGNVLQLGARENSKCSGLYVTKRGLGCNVGVREEFEHLPGFGEVLAAFKSVCRDARLRFFLSVVHIASDMVQQTMEQMIMQTLIAVKDKAQEIERHRPRLHAFQLVDRVIAHQGSIVRDAFVGDGQLRKNALGDGIEGAELLTAAEFALDFLIAEIAGFPFELCNRIQPWRIRQQQVQG